MNRQTLKQIANDTLTIIRNGHYTCNNKRVDLSNEIRQCVRDTKLYKHDEKIQKKVKVTERFEKMHMEVRLCSTLDAVQQELLLEPSASVAALNFASAKNPGGGFLKGSSAQEESLARTSALYECLISDQVKNYYLENEQEKLCLYTDNVIYSPRVPVFRSDQSEQLLKEPYLATFITAPAVNYNHASRRVDNQERIRQVFRDRADKVLAIAYENNHDVIVLGAWGCGVFGCPIAFTARMFRDLLRTKYKNAFKRVIFAIYDTMTCDSFQYALESDDVIEEEAVGAETKGKRPVVREKNKNRRDERWKKHASSSDGY